VEPFVRNNLTGKVIQDEDALNQTKKSVTLQDMAEKLGISKVSVSKALRGHSDIGKSTKEKVLALAAELGYRPNPFAQKLTSKHTRTIGLVVPKIAHHFLTRAIDAIYSAANDVGYEIIMMVSEEKAELEKTHIQTLLSMRVDGLLISVTEQTQDPEIFLEVIAHNTPLVFFDRVIAGLGASCITSADEDGSTQLVNCAIDKGFRSFGHIGGYQTVSIGEKRYSGFLKALQDHNIAPDPKHVIFGGFSRKDGYKGLSILIERGKLPEIIFAVTYPVALGILACARDNNISIPNDLDLVCFGSSNYNQFISPSITGITQPAAEIGELALSHLLQLIQGDNEVAVGDIVVPVQINQAETCIKQS